jgi:TctA family transporter
LAWNSHSGTPPPGSAESQASKTNFDGAARAVEGAAAKAINTAASSDFQHSLSLSHFRVDPCRFLMVLISII